MFRAIIVGVCCDEAFVVLALSLLGGLHHECDLFRSPVPSFMTTDARGPLCPDFESALDRPERSHPRAPACGFAIPALSPRSCLVRSAGMRTRASPARCDGRDRSPALRPPDSTTDRAERRTAPPSGSGPVRPLSG